MTPSRTLATLLAALALSAGTAMAAGPAQAPGRQFMTEQEQADMRIRMQNATTEEERDRIRAEEHALIRERAAAQGVTLPETPLSPGGQGAGQGAGTGTGTGTGPGAGAGKGPGTGGGMGKGPGRTNNR